MQMRLRRFFCGLLACLWLLFPAGCTGGTTAPAPANMEFEETPVTLCQGNFCLKGALTFTGVDNVVLQAEEPAALAGVVFRWYGGACTVEREDVSVAPAENNGCVRLFLQAVRAFTVEETVWEGDGWYMGNIVLRTDARGTPLEMRDKETGWTVSFGEERPGG